MVLTRPSGGERVEAVGHRRLERTEQSGGRFGRRRGSGRRVQPRRELDTSFEVNGPQFGVGCFDCGGRHQRQANRFTATRSATDQPRRFDQRQDAISASALISVWRLRPSSVFCFFRFP